MCNFEAGDNEFKFYKYTFFNIKEPIVIQAYNKKQSREILQSVIDQYPPEYHNAKIIGESVTRPVTGFTKKEEDGVIYIWAGTELSENGWMDEQSYLNQKNIAK